MVEGCSLTVEMIVRSSATRNMDMNTDTNRRIVLVPVCWLLSSVLSGACFASMSGEVVAASVVPVLDESLGEDSTFSDAIVHAILNRIDYVLICSEPMKKLPMLMKRESK